MELPVRISVVTSRPSAPWGPESDHRHFYDAHLGLFLVADATGPTYGGYYAPYAVDPGIEALVASYRESTRVSSPLARLRTAIEDGHRAMRSIATALDAAVAVRLAEPGATTDRLTAHLRAADDVRPRRFEDLRRQSFAHAAASWMALALDGRQGAVVGGGDCRAYRLRGAQLEVVGWDHTVGTVVARQGKPPPASPMSHVSTRYVGLQDDLEVEVGEFAVEPGDRFLLCTSAIWTAEDALRAAIPFEESGVRRLVAERAEVRHVDATVVVVRVGA